MLMDEPLVHVDLSRRPQYWAVIREHLSESGCSLVFATHEPDTAIRESEDVICMNEGQIIYSGRTEELYYSPPSAEVGSFLGPVNWFDRQESDLWIPEQSNGESGTGLRPENLHLHPDDDGPLKILSFHFSGSYAESLVTHIESSVTKTIIHRPVGGHHRAGQCVRLEVRS